MTITEANEFATVLRAFLNVKDDLLGRKPSCAQQIEAAQYLCHRASKALQLQIMSDSDIAKNWPRRNDPADPTSWDAEMVARYNALDPKGEITAQPGLRWPAQLLSDLKQKSPAPQVTSMRITRRLVKRTDRNKMVASTVRPGGNDQCNS
jgi:hypothetical protein